MTELYALALHDAPYVIAAYAIIWLGLVGYIVVLMRRMMGLDREVQILQDAVDSVDVKLGKATVPAAKSKGEDQAK